MLAQPAQLSPGSANPCLCSRLWATTDGRARCTGHWFSSDGWRLCIRDQLRGRIAPLPEAARKTAWIGDRARRRIVLPRTRDGTTPPVVVFAVTLRRASRSRGRSGRHAQAEAGNCSRWSRRAIPRRRIGRQPRRRTDPSWQYFHTDARSAGGSSPSPALDSLPNSMSHSTRGGVR